MSNEPTTPFTPAMAWVIGSALKQPWSAASRQGAEPPPPPGAASTRCVVPSSSKLERSTSTHNQIAFERFVCDLFEARSREYRFHSTRRCERERTRSRRVGWWSCRRKVFPGGRERNLHPRVVAQRLPGQAGQATARSERGQQVGKRLLWRSEKHHAEAREDQIEISIERIGLGVRVAKFEVRQAGLFRAFAGPFEHDR